MALRFPRFSQGLARDPTTASIWFVSNNFYVDFGNLFHVAWQGNFESWVRDPLHVRPIAHAIWDPHFGQPAVEAFTFEEVLGPGEYSLFSVFIGGAGWLHLQPKWKPSVFVVQNAESRLNHHFPDSSEPGNFLVHHAIALGLHTTTLILVKGALDARGSKLMPDKKISVIVFLATVRDAAGNVSQFNESSTYLMGWLRDYLWLNSSQLINGYNLLELIETLAWAHERTPLANLIRWRDKPVALSIVQARLVGLAHFSVGYIFTYAAFLIASTSGKFG
ncbi:hypothetical protein IFM89_009300 [Coptis chinensis]|uniref:Photosystem I P700 apoprotein A2 n=1 Tax=Coptis chinensis TaxID=261450 RepID=A0A835M4Y1_9MAGN|nr:hypothetical protein IFM89_009300 [Coptis chinensis]